MNKFIAYLFLAWLIISPVRAETDPKTIEFLKKLNLYYYSPGREGLRGFTCDLKVTTSQTYKDSLYKAGCDRKILAALDGQVIQLTFAVNGKKHYHILSPKKTGDSVFDDGLKEQLTNITKNLDPILTTLDGDFFQPLFGPKEFKGNNTVTSTVDGFVVREKAKDGSLLEMTFGGNAKMTNLVFTKNDQTLMTFSLDYSWGNKGYMLNGYSANMPSMNFIETDRFIYAQVGSYLLPVRIVKAGQLANFFLPGSSITFDASHFRLMESKKTEE